MKLLFDHNLSPRLVKALSDFYPGLLRVHDVDLPTADDEVVWNYAREHGFTIVSKDADFHQRSFLVGSPPKIVWIRSGNCSTNQIETILRHYYRDILAFELNVEASFLALG